MKPAAITDTYMKELEDIFIYSFIRESERQKIKEICKIIFTPILTILAKVVLPERATGFELREEKMNKKTRKEESTQNNHNSSSDSLKNPNK